MRKKKKGLKFLSEFRPLSSVPIPDDRPTTTSRTLTPLANRSLQDIINGEMGYSTRASCLPKVVESFDEDGARWRILIEDKEVSIFPEFSPGS